MKKFIAMILVVVMVFSLCGTAMAAVDNVVDGNVVVELKDNVTAVEDYASLFPELDIERIVPFERIRYFTGELYTILVLVLTEKTDEIVYEAIELLENNQYVKSAQPNWFQYYADRDILGDVKRDGYVNNVDLVLLARSIVELTELSSSELINADLNGDGAITNTDLVALAKIVVKADLPQISDELENQIISDFWINSKSRNIYIDEVLVHFGAYSGCEAVYMGYELSPLRLKDLLVGEYTFEIPTHGCSLLIYKDSSFMPIKEAYEAGWITDDDLSAIYNENVELLSMLKEEDKYLYKSTVMDAALEQRLSLAYTIYAKNSNNYVVDVTDYYGNFSGCEIVYIHENVMSAAVMVNIDVAGYWFSFGSPAVALYAYKDSQCLRLDEAYDAGWLTEDDIGAIRAM